MHDLTALTYGRKKFFQRAYLRWILPQVIRAADRVVCISAQVARELRDYVGVDATVIPTYCPKLEAVGRSTCRIRSRDFLVIGAHYSHKNLDLVLAAMRILRSQNVEARLVVAGCRRDLWWRKGGGLLTLEREGWLDVHDYAPDAQIENSMLGAAGLIYPSFSEGQGLPPLEALACGCPVICADIPVLRETCGDAAFFVDPHDPGSLAALLGSILAGKLDREIADHCVASARVLERFSACVLKRRWDAFIRDWK